MYRYGIWVMELGEGFPVHTELEKEFCYGREMFGLLRDRRGAVEV